MADRGDMLVGGGALAALRRQALPVQMRIGSATMTMGERVRLRELDGLLTAPVQGPEGVLALRAREVAQAMRALSDACGEAYREVAERAPCRPDRVVGAVLTASQVAIAEHGVALHLDLESGGGMPVHVAPGNGNGLWAYLHGRYVCRRCEMCHGDRNVPRARAHIQNVHTLFVEGTDIRHDLFNEQLCLRSGNQHARSDRNGKSHEHRFPQNILKRFMLEPPPEEGFE